MRDCHDGLTDLSHHDPWLAWAAAVTALGDGGHRRIGDAYVPETTVFSLREAGWSAAQDEGQLDVHVHLPGLFRAVRYRASTPARVEGRH